MRGIREELSHTGRLFAKNPAMVFVALFVVGLAVSAGVDGCRQDDVVLSGNVNVSRLMRLSRASAVLHGERANGAILRTLAYRLPAKKHKAPEKPAAPQPTASGPSASNRAGCGGLPDLRFPEFNLLIPLL